MISDYLKQSATLKRSTAVAADGSRTYDDGVEILVRFQPRTVNFTSANGEVIASEAQVFTTAEVKIGDTIEYGGRTYPIQRIYERRDLTGISHYEVWL